MAPVLAMLVAVLTFISGMYGSQITSCLCMLEEVAAPPCRARAVECAVLTRGVVTPGECGLDNVRTLCVLCHATVTAQQAESHHRPTLSFHDRPCLGLTSFCRCQAQT
eukprot:1535223-Rhodomonas_salina.1